MQTLIPCPYCSTQFALSAPIFGAETRANCPSCGARVGVQLKSFKRGQPKAKRERIAQARALKGKRVQLVREIRSRQYINNERPILALVDTVLRVRETEGERLFLKDESGKRICCASLDDVREYP